MSGAGNNSSQSVGALLENLVEICRSDYLSEKGLREIIGLHGCAPNNDSNINYEFFLEACGNERVTEKILRFLLKYFPNAARAIEEEDGFTSLHIICENKHVTLGMVQLLIDAFPESVRHESKDRCMPIHRLCNNEDLDEEIGLEISKLLLEKCPESVKQTTTTYGTIPIHLAAMRQSPEICRILIEEYPGSERIRPKCGTLPFHAACQCNTVATAKYLHQLYPESINVANNNGHYPIHCTIRGLKNRSNPNDGIEVVKFLLKCNPHLLSSSGKTPLHVICGNKFVTLNIVQLLIDAFPDSVRHEDNKGRMPLHKLCNNKNLDDEVGLEILKLLLERCPESVRHAAEGGRLPIHLAAGFQSLEFCRILIEAYPASGRLALSIGALPFHVACQFNNVATAKYLYQLYPESMNVADNNGFHPIQCAISGLRYRNNTEAATEMVRFLLDCDPNVALQMRRGKLPFYLVCDLATNDDTQKLNAYLKVLQIIYDAYPEAIESNEVTSNIGSFCEEVQTFINAQITYARQVRGHTVRQMKTRDENGQVPLHRALCDNVTLGSIKLLVKRNPSAITCSDNIGMIPLHAACQHESASVVKYLVGLDSDTLTIVDRDGNTALHHACRGAKYDTIALLLGGYGVASVSKRNTDNKLPIHLLLESNEVRDREDTKYLESIYRLLRAYPETLMHCTEFQGCLSQNQKKRYQKKRKIDEV